MDWWEELAKRRRNERIHFLNYLDIYSDNHYILVVEEKDEINILK